MTCSNCGTENRPGAKFCSECATPLAASCPTCGTANPPGAKFCSECATPLARHGPARGLGPAETRPRRRRAPAHRRPGHGCRAPAGERPVRRPRRVHAVRGRTRRRGGARDPHPLLRHRERRDRPVRRHRREVHRRRRDGGLGRARSPARTTPSGPSAPALELVDAVHALGPGIQARAGVLTGEAAVTIGATNQGMVAGDIVNTASRLQSAAAPGTVLVGEATAAGRVGRDRVRGRGRADPQGQGGAGPGMARRPRRRPARRDGTGATRSRRRSSAGTRSSASSRTCSRRRAGSAGRAS